MRARIADRFDGEGDMRSRWIDPPIRRRDAGPRGQRQKAERQDGADNADALENIFASGHETPHHFVELNIRGGGLIRFRWPTSLTRYCSLTSQSGAPGARQRILDSLFQS